MAQQLNCKRKYDLAQDLLRELNYNPIFLKFDLEEQKLNRDLYFQIQQILRYGLHYRFHRQNEYDLKILIHLQKTLCAKTNSINSKCAI